MVFIFHNAGRGKGRGVRVRRERRGSQGGFEADVLWSV